MINKDSKYLQTKINFQPEAVNTLRSISEFTYKSNIINFLKFPYNTIDHKIQEEEIADWGKGQNQTLHNQKNKLTKMNFKTVFKDVKQIRKNQRYKINLRTLSKDQFTEDVQSVQVKHNEEKKQSEKQRPRCALNNIIPEFQNDKKHQNKDCSSNRNKFIRNKHPYNSIQRKDLALKKIKKQLLNHLEARSKLPLSPTNSEQNDNFKKAKLYSEIHFKLNVQPQINQKKVSSTPKNIALASWHKTIKSHSNQHRDKSLIQLKNNNSAQYKLLKKLLQRQRN